MARIRKIEIQNFRSIQTLQWAPADGFNCLIGPGDSGKSTILDAIELCLSARRILSLSDSDFFALDVTREISISLTLGDLPAELKNIETYGDFLRAFDATTGHVEEEPRQGLETVLTLNLRIASDLEPVWTLISERAEQQGLERSIAWKDRVDIVPTRLGQSVHMNLSWAKNSILNRLSDKRASLGVELARASREARANFGEHANHELSQVLRTVTETATSLGVPVGTTVMALLDAQSVSIGDSAVTLHNEVGVPLRSLGIGSARLLIAGLQRASSANSAIVLVDELEHGLEPHRLTRLINSLGAKESFPSVQVFATTHSPVAVRELNGNQVFVVRASGAVHQVRQVGIADDVQSTIRRDPEAFLARTVIVCEGASEVGLIRGLDEYWVGQGQPSLFASGVAYIDVGGSEPDRCFVRGQALLNLGYRVIVLVDADKPPTKETVDSFVAGGGGFLTWQPGRTLEDELFMSLNDGAIHSLISRAVELVDEHTVDAHIRTHSLGKSTLNSVFQEGTTSGYSIATRTLLGLASCTKKNGWFKSVTKFEGVARDIVGPNLLSADPVFQEKVTSLFRWAHA